MSDKVFFNPPREETSCIHKDAVILVSTPPRKKHKKRKVERGQLKKLWRRATGNPPGITDRCDWQLFDKLHGNFKSSDATLNECKNGIDTVRVDTIAGEISTKDQMEISDKLPGPIVCLAKEYPSDFALIESWQTSEGCDHRDLLVNLLFGRSGLQHGPTAKGTNMQKKRKQRETNNIDAVKHGTTTLVNVPPLPSWSAICNQAGVNGIAVIEIEIDGGDIHTACPLMPSQRIKNSLAANSKNVWTTLTSWVHKSACSEGKQFNKVERSISAACRVNLFQEKHEPRSMSDVLMFLPPLSHSAISDNVTKNSGDFDLFGAMSNLLLKRRQLRSEGFPIISNDETLRSTDSIHERASAVKIVSEMSKLPLTKVENQSQEKTNRAIQLVNALSVNIESNDEGVDTAKDDVSNNEFFVESFKINSRDNHDRRQKIFALDCEMVKTSSVEPELARVSIIMFTGNDDETERSVVVLDELVKPRRAVLDYLTQYSGITPNMLQSIETRIEDIQVRLLGMIDKDDIIVGHSLENDLRALRFVHNKIIDTSVLFRGVNGRKFSLQHLSNVLMQKKIQCSSHGHCSTEDAEAALGLALRRARRGDSFKLKENLSRLNILSAFQKVNREVNGQKKDSDIFAERNDGSCVCIGENNWITKYIQSTDGAHHVLNCDSIMNTMTSAIPSWLSSTNSTKKAGLLWANLRCEDRCGDTKYSWDSEVRKLDDIVEALVERVPTHTPILMIFQSNYKKAAILTQQRKLSKNPKVTLRWSSEQEDQWKRYVEECRKCEAIWIGCHSFSSNR